MDKIRVNNTNIYDKQAILEEIARVLDSGEITNNGPRTKALEQQYKDMLGVDHCLAVSNGTIALQMAIRATGNKGEIITTPFSFIATVSSILWEHCKPVFADINPRTLCIDPAQVKTLITDRTQAILGVHVFGNACEVEALEAIGQEHDIKVIYDGAHALGSTYKGRSLLSYGDMTTVSLHAFKIATAAEGGLIISSDASLSETLFEMRYFGRTAENLDKSIGTNAKMSELNAAMGLVSLKYAEQEVSARQQIAIQYESELSRHGTKIQFQKITDGCISNRSYFPVIMLEEGLTTEILRAAEGRNIRLRRYFYPSLHELPYLEQSAECPISKRIAENILCLPTNSQLSGTALEQVVGAFDDVLL